MIGKLFLIPSFIGNEDVSLSFPAYNIKIVDSLQYFIVEELRSARRFIKKICPTKNIDSIEFYLFNEHSSKSFISDLLKPCINGQNIGLLSEAGAPCIADPGAEVVFFAHKLNIKVVPLIGPSSILLALMASGLNGQNFAFVGYLPIKKSERIKAIKFYEKRSKQENQTQCFIEAPYRNMQLLDDILSAANPDTLLCIAYDITLPSQYICTKTIQDWKNNIPDFQKHPAIFLLYAL